MDVTDFMGSSSYLKAADLKGKTVNVTVDAIDQAEFTDDKGVTKEKLIMMLANKEKGVVLNVTNTRACASAWGTDSDKWTGKKALLSVRQTPLGDGIGVTPITDDGDFDDDIPF